MMVQLSHGIPLARGSVQITPAQTGRLARQTRQVKRFGATYSLDKIGIKEHKDERFKQHNIKQVPGSKRPKRNKGRGHGGKGGASGRGEGGHKQRQGCVIHPWFEGGQNPLYLRLPKLPGSLGKMSKYNPHYFNIKLNWLNAFEDGDIVTRKKIIEKGIGVSEHKWQDLPLRITHDPVEDPPLKRKVTIYAHDFYDEAKEEIVRAGSKYTVRKRILKEDEVPWIMKDKVRKKFFRNKWIQQGKVARGDQEGLDKLYATDNEYLSHIRNLHRTPAYQKWLTNISLQRKAGILENDEEMKKALTTIVEKRIKLPPGFDPREFKETDPPYKCDKIFLHYNRPFKRYSVMEFLKPKAVKKLRSER